jgi:AcrR family transcriptional regulator
MTKPRWQRRKEARPAEILGAALDVFAERGFAAAKLEDVAARAGVSKGTLYLYFAGKEELFRSVVRSFLLPNIAAAEQRIARHRGSAADLVRVLVRTLGRLVAESKLGAIPKLIIAEATNFPDLAKFYHDEVISRGKRLMGDVLRRGVDSGEFRPVNIDEIMPMLVGPIIMLAVWNQTFVHVGAPPLPVEAALDRQVEFLLRALAPCETAAEEPTHA